MSGLNPSVLRWRLRHPLMGWDHAVSYSRFRAAMGRELNLDNPKLFADKLHWLKLYDRRKIHSVFADKLAVRQLVANAGFSAALNDIYAVWDTPADLQTANLPAAFVLKSNFGSSMNWFQKPGDQPDEAGMKKAAVSWYRRNHSLVHGESQYRDIERKLFAERWLGDASLPPPDYKIHCFDGEPSFIRYFETVPTYPIRAILAFDPTWNPIEMDKPRPVISHRPAVPTPPKPQSLPEMLALARALSKGEPFLRVDVFDVEGELKFCELTLHPDGGNVNWLNEHWERKLGDWTRLPERAARPR